jgi:ABC-type phosphate/phosphonate transport system substrate-binding protein
MRVFIFSRFFKMLAAAGMVAICQPTLAQGKAPAKKAATAASQLIFAVNEGASGNARAADIVLRYVELKEVIERVTGVSLTLVAVREVRELRNSLKAGEYALALSRPVDNLAVAVRDYRYQPVVVAKEVGQAYFVVPRDSPIKTIADLKGKRLATPEEESYMWHIVNAVLRENKIAEGDLTRKTMRDQAGIGWSVNNGFFDAGVVASFSGVGRNWEKRGGRIIAKSRDVPVTPLIASPNFSADQVARMRSALAALDGTEAGAAILKQIGISGFREADKATLIELLDWLGIKKT